MQKQQMRPVTFGCGNGFKELFYDVESPLDESRHIEGNAFCYLDRLSEDEKKDDACIKKCMGMSKNACWKIDSV